MPNIKRNSKKLKKRRLPVRVGKKVKKVMKGNLRKVKRVKRQEKLR